MDLDMTIFQGENALFLSERILTVLSLEFAAERTAQK